MAEKIILLGCGGHAKSVADAVETSGDYEIAGFVDNIRNDEFEYRGYKIIGCDSQLQEIYNSGIHYACICVGFLGKGSVRNKLYTCLKEIGFYLPPIIDPSAILAADVKVGEGAFIGKRAVVNSNAAIGKMAIINTAAVIEHDCVIGDFSHIAVSSVICGEAHIQENSFVGANATIIQGMNVGIGAVIGAGSVVVKNVEENMKFINKILPIYAEKLEGE